MYALLFAGVLAAAGAPRATPVPAPCLPSATTLSLQGRIADADSGLPLEFATVTAFAPDSAFVTGASTDSMGRYELVLPQGPYRLRYEYLGYVSLDTTLALKRGTQLGTIRLRTDAVALESATVTAQRSQLSLKLDKQIYDVGADITSAGGSANEVLENVPSVDVSPQGEVSLRGNAGVKVLINGKPSALADNNALQSIPAENIAKVEIMTAPSSRYEAAGSGGIINIILKDNAQQSVGGQVSASVGLPTDLRANASFSASLDKWTVFGNAGARYSEYFSTGESDRRSDLPSGLQLLREDLTQDRSDEAYNAFGGVDFRPTERTTLSASYSYYYQLDDDISDVRFAFRDGAGDLTRDQRQRLSYREPGQYNQIEASWSQDLEGEDRKLFVLFQNDFWVSPEQERTVLQEVFPTERLELDLETESLESSTDYLLQTDYEQPLGEEGKWGKLELGLRGEARVIESDYLAEQIVDGRREVYLGFYNQLDYYERIGAAYAQYAYEGELWGVQAGLRNEYTSLRVTQTNGELDIEKRFNNLFPTATLSRKINEKLSANLSYTTRIRRPGFWAINPFGGISNPNSIQLGNADINPSRFEFLELKALIRMEKLTINPFLRGGYVYAPFDRYATQDADGLVRLLLINLDRERQTGGGVTFSYDLTPAWQISGEAFASRFQMRGVYEGDDFAADFTMSNAQLSVRGTVVAGIKVQAAYDYWSGQQYAQSFRDPVSALRAGASRQFLDDRLQLSLNVRNLFGIQVFEGGSRAATFESTYARVWQQERWLLTAAWDIGKDVRQRRARGRIR